MCLEECWTVCSKYANHSRLNGQHGWVYEHLMGTRIFNLIMSNIIIGAPKTVRQMATGMIWIC